MTHNPSVYPHLSIRASQDASSRYWTSVFLNMFIPRHFAVTKTGGFGLDQKTLGVFITSIHMFFLQNDVWLVHDTRGWTIAWKKI